MAKGKALGLWKGKVGSNVFYKIKNSNNSQKQGIRERIYDVANPQSTGQATQRMKLNPANRLAAALKSIIERGFEGVKYGSMSRQAFMKYALAMNSGYPAVAKDNSIIYPGAYLISRGSLPQITCAFASDSDAEVRVNLTTELSKLTTFGALSTDLLEHNPFLQAGDQITFVYGWLTNSVITEPIIWGEYSFYLNESDTTEISVGGDVYLSSNDSRTLSLVTNYDSFAAAAVVLSRESSVGGHLRSNATLIYNSLYAPLFTDAAYEEARKTYQKKNAALNSDWPIVDDGESGSDDPVLVRMNKVLSKYDCAQYQNPMFFIGQYREGDLSFTPSILTGTTLSMGEIAVINEEDKEFIAANVRKLTQAEAQKLMDAGYTVPSSLIQS